MIAILTSLVLFSGMAAALPAEGIAVFQANAHAAAVINGHVEGQGEGARVMTAPSTDPYSQVLLHVPLENLPRPLPTEVLVEVHFVDEGACVIDPGLRWEHEGEALFLSPSRKSGYTRLNTQTKRTGWYAFQLPSEVQQSPVPLFFTASGLQHLREVRLRPMPDETAWQAHADGIPRDLTPMLALERPIQAVTTAGIDVQGGMDTLAASLQHMHELAPLAKVLGFTSIESYVTWKRLEPAAEGAFDFSFYDAIVQKLAEYDLKWFPLLIVGSAYALPEWFLNSEENVGMVCLEHGLSNPVQSIWYEPHRRHVERVLAAFGKHYGPLGVLEGVRLGPSGNYGESQYPAGGNWGVKGEAMHIHIGWWAGDDYAIEHFRAFLQQKYGALEALNEAWQSTYTNFDEIQPELPNHSYVLRRRLDFTQWYTDSMTHWCEWWGAVARKALPDTPIYQSSGGWGFREAGTDYSAQTKSMVKIDGGIRLTNETDSYEQNFYATRLATTAAKFYDVEIGYEPASSHTARGVAGRLYNFIATNSDHFFTYQGNILYHPMNVEQWLNYLPLVDTRQPALVEVAVYYPETFSQIEDSAFRHLYAWGFNPRAAAIRRVVDVDYLDERLIREGALDHYKALVFVWGNRIEEDVLSAMTDWMTRGGVILYPSFPKGPLYTLSGDTDAFRRWERGQTGVGSFHRFPGDMEPPSEYAEFVGKTLRALNNLDPRTQAILHLNAPEKVFFTLQQDGHILALNYRDEEVSLPLPKGDTVRIPRYGMARFALSTE